MCPEALDFAAVVDRVRAGEARLQVLFPRRPFALANECIQQYRELFSANFAGTRERKFHFGFYKRRGRNHWRSGWFGLANVGAERRRYRGG